ncbi:hypothetical protein R1sor_021282 [Riccia sorocarpa]|uniref:Trimethylguanosine synthase n=1 Tax=Riccia sorocarpa TaxID=122646 RepID=A0ABD3GKC9_9MARC
MCWKKLQDGEEPFVTTKNNFETLDEAAMLDEAKLLEPNKDVNGLVVDTTRAKKIKEAAHDEEEGDTTTPKKKSSETKNPGSGKWLYNYLQFLLPADLAGTLSRFVKAVYKFHSCYPGRGSKARAKQSTGGEKPPRKSRKKGVDEVEEEAVPEAGSSQQAPAQEVEPAAVDMEPVVVEVEVEAAEEADEERQQKRSKKRETEVSKLYEGYFRSDIFIPIPQTLVVARSSLKHTVDVLQANKSSAQKAKVVLVEELKGLCSRVDAFRTQAPKKLDDGGRRKCVGFVQTLLELYTSHGDIVVDFAGGWGATLIAAFNCSRCCIVLDTRKKALESMNLTLQRIEKKIQSLKPGSDKTTRAKPSDPVPSSDKARGKRPLGDDDDLGDDILGDDETSGFEDNVQLLNVWGRQTSAPRYEEIVRGLHSQSMSYSLPVYAAGAARRMAEMPRTPRDSRLDNRFVSNKRRNPFVDDIAQEDDEMAVNLSSHEE